MTRLPRPGGDNGAWGQILNAFLAVEHNEDGTLRRAVDIENAVVATGGGRERMVTITSTGPVTTLDLAAGNVQVVTLSANTSISITGATAGVACSLSVYLKQNATGGRVVTWDSIIKWPGGVAPLLTTTPLGIDLLVFESLDGGASWYGGLAGVDYR